MIVGIKSKFNKIKMIKQKELTASRNRPRKIFFDTIKDRDGIAPNIHATNINIDNKVIFNENNKKYFTETNMAHIASGNDQNKNLLVGGELIIIALITKVDIRLTI